MAGDVLTLQDPAETLSYAVDFTALLATGETVTAAPWSVFPAGPAIGDQVVATPATGASCQLAGVVLGGVYRLACTATTTTGRTLVQAIIIRGGAK